MHLERYFIIYVLGCGDIIGLVGVGLNTIQIIIEVKSTHPSLAGRPHKFDIKAAY